MARLKSTLIMTDTFSVSAPTQTVAKTRRSSRLRTSEAATLAITPPLHTPTATHAQTERSLPLGWGLLGLGVTCAVFWGVVAMVVIQAL